MMYQSRHCRKRRRKPPKPVGIVFVLAILATVSILLVGLGRPNADSGEQSSTDCLTADRSIVQGDTPDLIVSESDDSVQPDPTQEPEKIPAAEYDYSQPVPLSDTVENDYFNDAVFIGDSRTEGLFLYTGLSNAIPYFHKGLMVDTVFTNPVINKNGEKLSVIDALKVTDFKKVYIMLGINETGWPYNSVFIDKYGKVIDAIKEINPAASIYVQELLPVSSQVSSTHSYVKNEKIGEYNHLIREMAAEKEVYFVDTASSVAAEDGSLPADAASDGIHLTKEYCGKWLDYLKSHTVTE